MISPVNSLMNMELMLYGGVSGANAACPSYANGYMANKNSWANYYPNFQGAYQNNYNNNIWNSSPDTFSRSAASGVNNKGATSFEAAQNQALDVLGDYYIKGLAPSESILGAAGSGVTFALMNNPRLVVHPWNSLKSTFSGNVNKMFESVKTEGSALNKLWTNKKGGYELLTEAYARMHKLESLNNSKLGLFRKSIKGVKDASGKEVYSTLKTMMEDALRSGDPNKIARATEEIKRATNRYSGHIPNLLRKCGLQKPMTGLRKMINPSHYEEIGGVVTKNVTEAGSRKTFGQYLKHSCGIKGGAFFAGIEFLMDWGKIGKAFDKDKENKKLGKNTDYGWTQVRQTAIKGVGSAVGWAVGEGIGAWAGAKLGAAAGTAIAPGVGTVIGAVAGLVGGMIGCNLMGKLTHKINGKEAGDQIEVAEMKSTAEGRTKLLSLTLEQAEKDKKLDPNVAYALQTVAANYA